MKKLFVLLIVIAALSCSKETQHIPDVAITAEYIQVMDANGVWNSLEEQHSGTNQYLMIGSEQYTYYLHTDGIKEYIYRVNK